MCRRCNNASVSVAGDVDVGRVGHRRIGRRGRRGQAVRPAARGPVD